MTEYSFEDSGPIIQGDFDPSRSLRSNFLSLMELQARGIVVMQFPRQENKWNGCLDRMLFSTSILNP